MYLNVQRRKRGEHRSDQRSTRRRSRGSSSDSDSDREERSRRRARRKGMHDIVYNTWHIIVCSQTQQLFLLLLL